MLTRPTKFRQNRDPTRPEGPSDPWTTLDQCSYISLRNMPINFVENKNILYYNTGENGRQKVIMPIIYISGRKKTQKVFRKKPDNTRRMLWTHAWARLRRLIVLALAVGFLFSRPRVFFLTDLPAVGLPFGLTPVEC